MLFSLLLLTDGIIGVLGVDGVGILGWASFSKVVLSRDLGVVMSRDLAMLLCPGIFSLKKEAAAPLSCSLSCIFLLRTSLLPVVGSFSCLQMACSSSLFSVL